MAFACAACVANIYYNQPLLGDFAQQFGATSLQASWIATAAQAGYGAGMLFFVPLGDLIERRRLILILISACAVLLAAIAAAPNLPLLILAHFFMSTAAVGAQVIIPLAIDLVPAQARGRTLGFLMGGVLSGILLARTVAGFVGDWLGWRVLYGSAAVIMIAFVFALRPRLPHRPPAVRMSYWRLMASLSHLVRTQPRLWTSAGISALSFASFMAFWTTLSFLMSEHFHLGASETGLFGLVGLAGALCAPHAGRLSDWKGSAFTVMLALGASLAGFLLMWSWLSIAGLAVGVFLMDLGVQSIQVAEQSKALSLVPEAKSRINTIYMVVRFIGGALGSLAGSAAWTHWGWSGVCLFTIALTIIATILHFIGVRLDRLYSHRF